MAPSVASYYYLLYPLGGDGTGWTDLPRALAANNQPGFLSIALLPTHLTDLEREAVDHVSTIASYLSEPQQEYDYFGNLRIRPGDAGARDVCIAWQQFPERQGVLARIGISASVSDLQRLGSLIGSALTRRVDDGPAQLPSRFKLVPSINEYEAYMTSTLGLIYPRSSHSVWSLPPEQAPVTLERLPYFFNEEEAGGLAVLPVPSEDGVPGLPLSRAVAGRRQLAQQPINAQLSVSLGTAIHYGAAGDSVGLPLPAINRHVLVVGGTGSGKTTTVLSLLARLWRQHHVPFLVIEPIKTEYRSLLEARGLEELYVVSLGREDISPLRLNPLAPPPGVRREVHVSAVMAALKMALPLFPPLPQLLGDALDHAYVRAGWEEDATVEGGIKPPTLRDLLDSFEVVFAREGYVGEAQNVGTAGRVRLRSLLRGSLGRMLDTVESVDFDSLMNRPVVIELDQISDADDKAVLGAFLLDRVRAAARARGSTGGVLRHVTVVEEAHRLLSRAASHDQSPHGDSVRAESVRAFCEAIAELRAQGEGFVLSSQSPSALAQAAVANTGTRILHRVESAEDRAIVLGDMDANALDREAAARLRRGEAIVRWPEQDEAELVQVSSAEGIDSSRHVADELVIQRMAKERRDVQSLLPYPLCTRTVCTKGCDASVRSGGRRIATGVGPAARRIWERSKGAPTSMTQIAPILAGEAIGQRQLAYCGAVHLAVSRDAFMVRQDIRVQLAEAVTKAVNNGL